MKRTRSWLLDLSEDEMRKHNAECRTKLQNLVDAIDSFQPYVKLNALGLLTFHLSQMHDLLTRSESLIEQLLGVHLSDLPTMIEREAPLYYCEVRAQEKISLCDREYRVDFLVFVERPAVNGTKIEIVVECDGHNFHERTKEQAERDRSRDRALMAAGYYVMRFTGAEIWRDPVMRVHEICQFVINLLSRTGDLH